MKGPPNFLTTNNNSIGQQYSSVSMSSTGQYILATTAVSTTSGNVYLSTNFGATFSGAISSLANKSNKSCAISGTGQYMVVVQGSSYMYRSGDYGSTWQQVTNISTTQNWVSTALSKDGKYCIANGNNPTNNIYISANFDTANPTFTQVSIWTTMNTALYFNTVSSNGQYMIQLQWRPADGIAISSNYGVTFTKLTFTNIGITDTLNPNSIIMTPDGSTVYYSNYGTGIYKSTNLFSGSPMFTKIISATFTEQSWNSVVVSSDGTYVVASTDLKTYYSKDSGLTWTVCLTGTVPIYMAMSDNANYIIGVPTSSTSKLLLSTS